MRVRLPAVSPPAVTHAESIFREVFPQVQLVLQGFLIELRLELRQLILQVGDLGLVRIGLLEVLIQSELFFLD